MPQMASCRDEGEKTLQASTGVATRIVSVMLAMLLAVTMVPAAGLPQAFADEPAERPATSGGDVALESASGDAAAVGGAEVADSGLRYVVADGAATLVGFEDGASLEGALVVPETVSDGAGTATVKAVEIADGQVAGKVTALALPQTVESVRTEGLAAAFPALASVEVAFGNAATDGNDNGAAGSEGGAAAKGAYSSVAGMLFRSAEGQASSDGTAFAEDALELVWAPPAMVVARIPLECKSIAAGAFVDAAALETVMSFGKMESIASAERDAEGNVTKPGAFADEQVGRLTIVVPGTNYAVTGEGAERVSGSVALSEKTDMLEKRKAWFHHGFDTGQIIMGAPFGEIEGVNAVSDEGVMEDRSLVTPLENGKSHLELTPEEEAEKAERRGEDPEAGLSFSYQASMDLSVRWTGDRSATPARVEIPAYAKVDGVTYQVTQIEPSAFEGAVFLASVAIPEGVTAIGESAFAGCTNLKEVSLPSTLKTIDYAAFKGTALESVTIPEGATYIGGEAFADCASLEDAQVGASTLVGTDAFTNSPAGAYVQSIIQQSALSDGLQEIETPTDTSTPAEVSDSISAYAAPPGASQPGNLAYYTSWPTSYPDILHTRVIGSPYYDIRFYNHKHNVLGHNPDPPRGQCTGSITVEQAYNLSESLADGDTIATNSAWMCFSDLVTNGKEGSNFVELGGKRCLAFISEGKHNNDSVGFDTFIFFIPKTDDVYMLGAWCLREGGGLWHQPTSLSNAYAGFAPSYNLLSLVGDNASSVSLTTQNSSSWSGSGTKAKVEDKFTVVPKPGYSLGNVTVTGEGTTYDAATKTLTMGWADSTVSAELIPNDIDVTFNLPHAYVSGKNAGVYGNDGVVWGEGDAANTMTIKTEATVDNTNGTTPMPNQSTITVSGSQATFRNGQGQAGYSVNITPHNGWQHQGAWALSYKDGDEWVDVPSFTSTQSAVIDYTKEWRLTPIITGRTFTITYDDNHANAPVAGGQYTTGNGLTSTPTPRRTGFWFAGWAWANDAADRIDDPAATSGFGDASWYPGDGIDADAPSFTVSGSAYGNAQLKAIWKPKTYKITYNVEATKKDDGSYWVDTPAEDVFVHPSARSVIASGSNVGATNESWAFTKSVADYRSQDGIDASALAAGEGGASALNEGTINYELPQVPFEGYLYKGWTKQVGLPAGLSVSNPDDGPYLAFSAEVAGKLWPNEWDAQDTEPAGTHVESSNAITLYGVWLRQGVVTVNLESSDPAEVADGRVDDGASVKVNGANVAATHVQPVAYWKDRGLMLYGEMGEPGHNITGIHEVPTSDSKIADTRVVNSATKQRAFQAPTRTGFRFLGWGDAATGTLYVKYFESAEGTGSGAGGGTAAAGSHEQGFYLTPAGMERSLRWDTGGADEAADENEQETWDALWEIRTYEIELMVPGSAIKGYAGVSAADKELNKDYTWNDAGTYKWEKEITIGDDNQYATSWRKATKEWKYWDAFYVPFYETNSPFNTYGGWFTGVRDENGVVNFDRSKTDDDGNVVPIIRETEGRARYIDGGKAFRVSAAGLGASHLWPGAPEGQETDLDNVVAPDGTITLWLYTEPVYINVSAPMGIFLANDDPYVVGSDPRTVLEQEASFTVKESNQNLVLTSITATDIVEADVEQGTYNANAAYPVENVVTTEDDAGVGQQGITARMLTPSNLTDQTKGTDREVAYDQENSRVFWVSPVETVDEYKVETASAPNEKNMTSRVYFGYGSETESGMAAGNGDNVVEDDPDDEKDHNFLKAFKLREAYDGAAGSSLSGKNGVAVTTDDAGVVYTSSESVGTGAGSTAGTVAGAKFRDPDNAEWTLAVAGGSYTLAKADGTVVHVKKPVVYRDYSFWYGLDLNKCSFDLAAIQEMVEAEEGWSYNAGYRKPLVKLMFTFAVERVPNVSYGVAALSADEADAGVAVLDERTGTEGGAIDADELVGVGGVSTAL